MGCSSVGALQVMLSKATCLRPYVATQFPYQFGLEDAWVYGHAVLEGDVRKVAVGSPEHVHVVIGVLEPGVFARGNRRRAD